MKRKVFRSRISVLIIGIFLALYVFIIPSSIRLFQDKLYGDLCMVWIPLLGIPIFIFGGFRYIISGNILYLKSWFISVGIVRIDDIISVERTYFTTPYPAASIIYPVAPSASLKFLRIRYDISQRSNQNRPDFWLISPVREQEFIEELLAVDPDIFINVPVKKGIWRFLDI